MRPVLKNNLRVARARCRVSQLHLAIALDSDPTRVWRIENGHVVPSAAEKAAIAKALACGEEDIWPLEDETTSKIALVQGAGR